MKRLITQQSELNEATRQSAPIEAAVDAAPSSQKSYTPDTEAEPMTTKQLAERYRRRKGYAAKLADLTLSEEDVQKLLSQSDDEDSVGTQEQVKPSSIPEAAKAEDIQADSQQQKAAGDSNRGLPSRRELRERERAAKKDKSIAGVGKRAISALNGAARVVREEADAVRHRGMQRVPTENDGDIWVKVRQSAYVPRNTPTIHR